MLAPWVTHYISPPIPFKDKGRDHDGADCWGFVRLIQREQFGIEMPDYSERYLTARDELEVSGLIAGEMTLKHVDPVAADKREPGDLMLFLSVSGRYHIGVYAGRENGEDWFVHQSGFGDSCRSRVNDRRLGLRLMGYHRWMR